MYASVESHWLPEPIRWPSMYRLYSLSTSTKAEPISESSCGYTSIESTLGPLLETARRITVFSPSRNIPSTKTLPHTVHEPVAGKLTPRAPDW